MPVTPELPLTGERTVPGIVRENYWFRRHAAVYEWLVSQGYAKGEVLEAGCGEGYGAELLRSAGAQITALDYDEAAVDHVRARYPLVAVEQANLDALPMGRATVDTVVSLQVIEHLWDLRRFLAECARVLRPGGAMVLSTPNRVTFSPGVGRGQKPTNPFHVEEFDAEQLVDLVTEAGFVEPVVLGLSHGKRLTDIEHRDGSLVARQIHTVLTDAEWPADLLATVASVTTADFDIAPVSVTGALQLTDLDLVITATATSMASAADAAPGHRS